MKISKTIPSRSANPNNQFLGDFAGIALKLERVGPIFQFLAQFSTFNPCSSLPSVACNRDREQFQCPNIASDNKTEPISTGK